MVTAVVDDRRVVFDCIQCLFRKSVSGIGNANVEVLAVFIRLICQIQRNLTLPVQGYTVYHGVFHQCLQQERRNLPFSDITVHRRFKGKGFFPVPQLLDADICLNMLQFFLYISLFFGILKNIAHIIRQHRCNFHNLSLMILIRNAMNQAQAVQEKMRLDLFLRIFQLGFLFGKLFFVDRNFQSLYFPQQFLEFAAHRLQL